MAPASKARTSSHTHSRTMSTKRGCRTYGSSYPLLVALVVTFAFLSSLYSSSGCQFIEMNVGYPPTNRAWNESDLQVGLFFQHRPDDVPQDNEHWSDAIFHASCHPYTDAFEEDFIKADPTWKAARIMAHIASISGLLASVIAWAIAVFPIASECLWPILLLPCVMLAFIGEGSKFLFLDIALCKRPIWFPTAPDSLPTSAEACNLGLSAYACIVAGALHGIGLLMVCWKTPSRKRRRLEAQHRTQANVDEPVQVRSSFDENNHINSSSLVIHGIASEHETRQPSIDEEWEADETSREEASDFDDDVERNSPHDTIQKIAVSESRLSVKSKMEMEVYSSQSKEERVNEFLSDLDASFRNFRTRTLATTHTHEAE